MDNGLTGFDAEDVTADLVAKLDPASLQSEEGSVATFLAWSSALNGNFESGSSDDLVNERDDLGSHVVTRGLQELGACRPGSLSVVAHPPGLAEAITTDNFVLVREAFLDEASGEAHVLGLLCDWGLSIPRVHIIKWVLGGLEVLGWSHHLSSVLADKLLGGLRLLADLEKWVLIMYSVLLTGLAEVSVSAY